MNAHDPATVKRNEPSLINGSWLCVDIFPFEHSTGDRQTRAQFIKDIDILSLHVKSSDILIPLGTSAVLAETLKLRFLMRKYLQSNNQKSYSQGIWGEGAALKTGQYSDAFPNSWISWKNNSLRIGVKDMKFRKRMNITFISSRKKWLSYSTHQDCFWSAIHLSCCCEEG